MMKEKFGVRKKIRGKIRGQNKIKQQNSGSEQNKTATYTPPLSAAFVETLFFLSFYPPLNI
ncbi:hypothetical protein [Alkalimonas amylolytica]|uniref:Uncharacterized protein n=1 Tax=Alkalimonas amylolytica TaxID=152573 RepID=A0A1H3ZP99_ALKAM|nr:hypothetical protein [Alkalimonas amylolytica]SEA25468.1 hypothetical protein SAMN04488051_102285 [Alkalimonas amylolytica]